MEAGAAADPFEIDFVDDAIIPWEEQMRTWHERLHNLGQFTTHYLGRCFAHEEDGETTRGPFFMDTREEQARVQGLFQKWRDHMILSLELLKEPRIYHMQEGRVVKIPMGTGLFVELSRLWLIANYPRLMLDDDDAVSLKNTKHDAWVSIRDSFDVNRVSGEDVDEDAEALNAAIKKMWETPILHYTLPQVVHLIFFLSQQLNDLQEDCVEEYRDVFNDLWIRIAQLLSEGHSRDVFYETGVAADDEDAAYFCQRTSSESIYVCTKEFATFCFFYGSEIVRRLYYHELLISNKARPPERLVPVPTNCAKEWITRTLIDTLADEAFSDMYTENAAFGYTFPGDDEWFRFRWPTKVHSRAACLSEMRPHLFKRYFSEENTSKHIVLERAATAYICQTFLLKALSSFIQIKLGTNAVRWYDAVVVHSGDIKMSAYMLQSNACPLLLQITSNYYAYDQGRVYLSENIYETIAVWFYLLRTRYKDTLHTFNLGVFADEILSPPLQRAAGSSGSSGSSGLFHITGSVSLLQEFTFL